MGVQMTLEDLGAKEIAATAADIVKEVRMGSSVRVEGAFPEIATAVAVSDLINKFGMSVAAVSGYISNKKINGDLLQRVNLNEKCYSIVFEKSFVANSLSYVPLTKLNNYAKESGGLDVVVVFPDVGYESVFLEHFGDSIKGARLIFILQSNISAGDIEIKKIGSVESNADVPIKMAGARDTIDLTRWMNDDVALLIINDVVCELSKRLPSLCIELNSDSDALYIEYFAGVLAVGSDVEFVRKRIALLDRELGEKNSIIRSLEQRVKDFSFRIVNGESPDREVHAAVLFLDVAGYSSINYKEKRDIAGVLWNVASALLGGHNIYVSNTWGDAIVVAFESTSAALSCAFSFVDALKAVRHHARGALAWGRVSLVYNPARNAMDLVGQTVDLAARLEPLVKTVSDAYTVIADEDFVLRSIGVDGVYFSFKEEAVVLQKAIGIKVAGDKLQCYGVRDLRN
ncbi:MAG: hypothetical protein HQL42_11655 [Alphaproteobacteria bacterium]|nr:hypothetical protein [Alphaproteobacteria bacterium]